MDATTLAAFLQDTAIKYSGADWLDRYAADAVKQFGGTADSWSHRIKAAAQAHHEFESNELGGKRDEEWAGWYATYIIKHANDAAQ